MPVTYMYHNAWPLLCIAHKSHVSVRESNYCVSECDHKAMNGESSDLILVPKQKATSAVWVHFGLQANAEGKKIEEDVAVCWPYMESKFRGRCCLSAIYGVKVQRTLLFVGDIRSQS